MAITTTKKGFTIFFAMLVGSLALSIGLAIYDLTVRELDISGTATQSQYAIYAADTGIECALYWDFKCELTGCQAGSVFATSSQVSSYPTSGVTCNGADVAATAVAAGTWLSSTAAAATTTFTLTFAPQPYCTTITVAKYGSPTKTTITSRGYNTCLAGSPSRLERALRVNY